jgi:predicted tellurium resistance membrane protein TerC
MSFDNVVAIAAIAQRDVLLLVIGLVASIPLLVAGAALVAALLDRFPILIWAGAALLGWIAGETIVTDPALSARLGAALGATLAQQLEFAGAVTGAVLAIATGGLWQRLHELNTRSRVGEREAAGG